MKWWEGLSVRAANILHNHYRHNMQTNLCTFSRDDVKAKIYSDIENGKIKLSRIKNCGKKSSNEILAWVGISDNPLYHKPVAELVKIILQLKKDNEVLKGMLDVLV